jgi:casein kinase II subunit beta
LNQNTSKEKLKQCLKIILSPSQPSEEDLADEQFLELNTEASDLYGQLHVRFLHSPRGLAKVYQKFLNGVYGTCPRALCDRQKVLPIGLSDNLRTSRFKIFCPKCEEVYVPKTREVNLDGAFFGTSFPHVFLKHYPLAVILPPKIFFYEPKISGFKVHGKRGSKYYEPPKGCVKYNEDSMQAMMIEENLRRPTEVE